MGSGEIALKTNYYYYYYYRVLTKDSAVTVRSCDYIVLSSLAVSGQLLQWAAVGH